MEHLRLLLILLQISEANFRTLHWMAAGDKFEQIHLNCEKFVDMVGEDMDTVAEMSLRLSSNLPTLKAVSTNPNAVIDTHGELVHFAEFCKYATSIFEGICNSIEACLEDEEIADDISNIGIKSSLEAMHDKYDLQARYLIKRRMQ